MLWRITVDRVHCRAACRFANAAFGYDAKNWGIDVNVHNITNQRYFIPANAAGALVGDQLSAVVTVHASF